MSKQQFHLISSEVRANAIAYISMLPDGEDWVISVDKRKAKRSLAQNSLLFAWHSELADHRGESQKKQHSRFKYMFVLPILLAELDGEEGDHLRQLYELVSLQGPEALEAFADLAVSSTLLSVKQFTNALGGYDRWAAQTCDYVFQKRDTEYHMAMGNA